MALALFTSGCQTALNISQSAIDAGIIATPTGYGNEDLVVIVHGDQASLLTAGVRRSIRKRKSGSLHRITLNATTGMPEAHTSVLPTELQGRFHPVGMSLRPDRSEVLIINKARAGVPSVEQLGDLRSNQVRHVYSWPVNLDGPQSEINDLAVSTDDLWMLSNPGYFKSRGLLLGTPGSDLGRRYSESTRLEGRFLNGMILVDRGKKLISAHYLSRKLTISEVSHEDIRPIYEIDLSAEGSPDNLSYDAKRDTVIVAIQTGSLFRKFAHTLFPVIDSPWALLEIQSDSNWNVVEPTVLAATRLTLPRKTLGSTSLSGVSVADRYREWYHLGQVMRPGVFSVPSSLFVSEKVSLGANPLPAIL